MDRTGELGLDISGPVSVSSPSSGLTSGCPSPRVSDFSFLTGQSANGVGRTYGELDVLFDMRVPARKFRETVVDEFEAAERDAANVGAAGGVVH
jgi:hypothetical protein